MIKKLVLAIAAVVAVLAIVIATRPTTFRISRSAVIAAPPATVFAQVNDFHRWEAWSPWAALDPDSTATFEGPESGTGAIFRWSGNSEVGEGSQEIVESQPNELIRIRLDFVKPFAATNDVEFDFEPEGNDTRVTWIMTGENNFVGKAMSLVMDCDDIVGPQFEQGLANLAAVSAKAPRPQRPASQLSP